jgi:hypothetical protein
MLEIMWMTNIASVVLKYVWYSIYMLEEINKKLILTIRNPFLGYRFSNSEKIQN